MSHVLTYGSLCSGVEAATVAWHPLGWQPQWFSEIEAFPSAVLKHHYPEVPNLGDMTKLHERKEFHARSIDVLVGGTPCQSFSVAGLRKGMADPRGNLALEYLRIADTKRPRWVIWENVPGVLSSSKGEDFRAFISGLVRWDVPIPPGGWQNSGIVNPAPTSGAYGVAWRVLDAQYFGVAQRRRRVFVIGYLGNWKPAFEVLFEPHSMQGHSAPRREEKERTSRGSEGSSGERRQPIIIDRAAFNAGDNAQYTPVIEEGEVMASLVARGPHAVATGIIPFDTTQITSPANRSNPQPGDPCHPLVAQGHAPSIVIPINSQAARREHKEGDKMGMGVGQAGDPAYTLQAQHEHIVAQIPQTARMTAFGKYEADNTASTVKARDHKDATDLIFSPEGIVRRLMPVECERLQGFPDNYTLIPSYAKGAKGKDLEEVARWLSLGNPELSDEELMQWASHPDSPRYKAMGNSMCVKVMEWLGERINTINMKYQNLEKTWAMAS